MLDHHDAIIHSIIETAEDARLKAAIDILKLVGLPAIGDVAGIIDDDEAGAIAGNAAMDRNRAKFTAGGRLEITAAIVAFGNAWRIKLLEQSASQNAANV